MISPFVDAMVRSQFDINGPQAEKGGASEAFACDVSLCRCVCHSFMQPGDDARSRPEVMQGLVVSFQVRW